VLREKQCKSTTIFVIFKFFQREFSVFRSESFIFVLKYHPCPTGNAFFLSNDLKVIVFFGFQFPNNFARVAKRNFF